LTTEARERRPETPARKRERRMEVLRRRRDHLANVMKERGEGDTGYSWTKAEHAALVWAIQVLEGMVP
jgi:hypothetical protein